MILKHHLGNDKKRSAGLNEAKIKIISPFPEKVNVSQSNMLSYKYLNTKFSPDVCTSPGLFSPELTVTSLHLLLRVRLGTITCREFTVTSYGWSPVINILHISPSECSLTGRPAGCFCVYFKTLLWQPARLSPAQLRSFIILHQNRSFQ